MGADYLRSIMTNLKRVKTEQVAGAAAVEPGPTPTGWGLPIAVAALDQVWNQPQNGIAQLTSQPKRNTESGMLNTGSGEVEHGIRSS